MVTTGLSPDFWTEERLNSVNGMMGKTLASFSLDPSLTESDLDVFIQSVLEDHKIHVCDRVDVSMAAVRGFVSR